MDARLPPEHNPPGLAAAPPAPPGVYLPLRLQRGGRRRPPPGTRSRARRAARPARSARDARASRRMLVLPGGERGRAAATAASGRRPRSRGRPAPRAPGAGRVRRVRRGRRSRPIAARPRNFLPIAAAPAGAESPLPAGRPASRSCGVWPLLGLRGPVPLPGGSWDAGKTQGDPGRGRGRAPWGEGRWGPERPGGPGPVLQRPFSRTCVVHPAVAAACGCGRRRGPRTYPEPPGPKAGLGRSHPWTWQLCLVGSVGRGRVPRPQHLPRPHSDQAGSERCLRRAAPCPALWQGLQGNRWAAKRNASPPVGFRGGE